MINEQGKIIFSCVKCGCNHLCGRFFECYNVIEKVKKSVIYILSRNPVMTLF